MSFFFGLLGLAGPSGLLGLIEFRADELQCRVSIDDMGPCPCDVLVTNSKVDTFRHPSIDFFGEVAVEVCTY